MRIVLVLCIAILLVGCTTNPSKMDSTSVHNIADKLTYIKDTRTGLCFAAVASRTSGDTDQNGFTITWVPCEQIPPEMFAK